MMTTSTLLLTMIKMIKMMATTAMTELMVMIPRVVNPSGGWSGQDGKTVRRLEWSGW